MAPVFEIIALLLRMLPVLACVALVAAAFHVWRKHPVEETRKRLFPYLVAAGFFGLMGCFPTVVEWFVAEYSGAQFEVDGLMVYQNPGGDGTWWWLWQVFKDLPGLLPLAGLVPALGRRAPVVMGLGLAALVPAVLRIIEAI